MMVAKAQISYEYLSVYVWSALALGVILGVMGYLGVFDASNFQEESCDSGSQIVCADATIYEDGLIAVMVQNNLPNPIRLVRFEVFDVPGITVEDRYDTFVLTGEYASLVLLTGVNHSVDSQEDLAFSLSYQTQNNIQNYNVTGTFSTAVLPGLAEVEREICGDGYRASSEGCDPPGDSSTYCAPNQYCSSDCQCTKKPKVLIAFPETNPLP